MQIFENIKSLQIFLSEQRQKNRSIGFVPTMGALHPGHLSLLKQAKNENDLAICSVYVNPTQFNNTDDLEKYPRNLNLDKNLLENVNCDVLFCPTNEEMYPYERDNGMAMSFGRLDQVLEGKFRPGHFSGVGLVLSKFFHIVQADKAYFGQKDLQQCSVVQKLVDELFFDTQLVIVPTVREDNGLALSSRNERLSAEGKKLAANLYQALQKVSNALQRGKTPEQARQEGVDSLSKYSEIELEYLEVVDKRNFMPPTDATPQVEVAVCTAAYVEGVRLIDNILVFS